jgi:hypothetical protein
MSLTLSGSFRDTTPTNVLSILQAQKATGTLTCTARGVEKSLYVQGGQIVFATSKDEQDRLGEIMVQQGKINRSQLERSLQIHRNSDGVKKIGAIFVENGYVTPKDLFNGLKQQVRNIIHSLFLLRDGQYRFQEHLPSDIIPLPINMEEVLRDVISEMKKGK